MDINRLNPLNFLGFTKKTNKAEKSSPASQPSSEPGASERAGSEGDYVSISQEALVKRLQMEVREEFDKVREEKVNEIKEKVSSGQYKVSSEDVAATILKGKIDIYEELK